MNCLSRGSKAFIRPSINNLLARAPQVKRTNAYLCSVTPARGDIDMPSKSKHNTSSVALPLYIYLVKRHWRPIFISVLGSHCIFCGTTAMLITLRDVS